jgi:hypothetical protein
MSDEDNFQRQCRENHELILKLMPIPKFLEYWYVEHKPFTTGDWFPVTEYKSDKLRFKSEQEARDYCIEQLKETAGTRWSETQWRTVHVTLERDGNKTVTTEITTEVTL